VERDDYVPPEDDDGEVVVIVNEGDGDGEDGEDGEIEIFDAEDDGEITVEVDPENEGNNRRILRPRINF